MLGEFDHEMAGTRKVLERTPADRLDYRPHPKSWTLGQLASHLARLPRWVPITLNEPGFDYTPSPVEEALASPADILAEFDRSVAAARSALASCAPSVLGESWTFRVNGVERFTMPKAAVYRVFCMNHHLHHRGQLTIYLRETDTPVPGLYGPSADEVR
jgi:uncharacterized damage-inducible protein DinB